MRVSANGRYLEHEGTPFFYLGENMWNLLYGATRDEIRLYLDDRRDKGFTVVMPVVLRELGLPARLRARSFAEEISVHGEMVFVDADPQRPNEAFFRHVDFLVDEAQRRGLWVGLYPTWAHAVGPRSRASGPLLFDEASARGYGRFLGRRYRDAAVIWHVGGDLNPEDEALALWRAMAGGLREGDVASHPITYHPIGGWSSSAFVHDEPWLDFNGMQTSTRHAPDNWNWILADRARAPAKPTIDIETRYEGSHRDFVHKSGARVTAHQVRKCAYNAMLSGALGHTYGCRDVWSLYVPRDGVAPSRDVDTHWREALQRPGAWQVGRMRRLFERCPWHRLVPEPGGRLVVEGSGEAARPGCDRERRVPDDGGRQVYVPAAVADDGSFALVYLPEGQQVACDLRLLSGSRVNATWFDPRNGTFGAASGVGPLHCRRFDPPAGEPDWVLVLEAVN